MGEISLIAPLMLGVVFALLALLHFSWFLGSQWGLDASLPTDETGKRVLNPKKVDSLIVGLGLALFSAFYFAKWYDVQLAPNQTIASIISWLIPSIFLLRSIGEFRYVGLFKKVKNTRFGKLDTTFIIPLCLIIAVLGFLVI